MFTLRTYMISLFVNWFDLLDACWMKVYLSLLTLQDAKLYLWLNSLWIKLTLESLALNHEHMEDQIDIIFLYSILTCVSEEM